MDVYIHVHTCSHAWHAYTDTCPHMYQHTLVHEFAWVCVRAHTQTHRYTDTGQMRNIDQ